MSHRKTFLFFTLLTLALLTQIIVFRWGPEAIFFITWLLLALAVQHDSRLSVAIGLAFLVTCPFLLIAKKDTVAEQAANYAYFFLAIGVIVQLEELLMERYSWLACKVDFSYLWRPLIQAFRRRWREAVVALGRGLAAADRTELVRLIQVLGSAGLTVVFLWAAFNGTQFLVVLPLLGGAFLFPFIVWGLQLTTRALGPARLLRVMLTLVVLPLIAMEMVWLYNLISADRLAHMEVAYSFITHLPEGKRTSPFPEGEVIKPQMWTIGDLSRPVLYQHPAFSGVSRLAYTVYVEHGNVLVFDVSTAPESWLQPGDGVTFAIYVESDDGAHQLFSTYIDPKHNPADRRWHPFTIDLSEYAGQKVTIIFETGTGPAGDYRYDWAGWGEPRIVKP
jgi:hypothetical protein